MSSMAAKLVLLALAPAAVLGAVYTVTVGIDETTGDQGLGFDPTSIRPNVGDTITFTFAMNEWIKEPKTVQHSATQSTFEAPCTPLKGGFDTGVHNTGSVHTNTGDSFDFPITSTDPLWFYSSVGNDCKTGMVFAVNPPLSGAQTYAAFHEAARASNGAQQPPPSSDNSTETTGSDASTPSQTDTPPNAAGRAAPTAFGALLLGAAAMFF